MFELSSVFMFLTFCLCLFAVTTFGIFHNMLWILTKETLTQAGKLSLTDGFDVRFDVLFSTDQAVTLSLGVLRVYAVLSNVEKKNCRSGRRITSKTFLGKIAWFQDLSGLLNPQ